MAVETELKLLVQTDQLALLQAHPLLNDLPDGRQIRQRLYNCYYDTPQFDLRDNRISVRVRQTPDQFIQTLKTAGSREAGLSRRNEWEWPLISEQLDLELLTPPDWPLGETVKQQLMPCFVTDFERQIWWLEWQGDSEGEIEVALDIGQISAAGNHQAICELELELKSGNESILHELAALLSETLDLTPSDISKAQRGFEMMECAL